ncbi:tyrosine-type recombinase/integrase [Planctomicrobium sp. SH527]|uniref:tyrosine-type recombinase/integrase n=1 Tax=Planctomicrobium sp. SH527 TaxID=3448123 RepID=UPI003F5AEC2B
MARVPKPWYWKSRRSWFVTIDGQRHSLGPDKKQASDRFYELMGRPRACRSMTGTVVEIIDTFLDWVQKHRSADTYEWYRYRLQRFAEAHPDLRTDELKPFHVQRWVDRYDGLSKTSRRNYTRSVKRCVKWALQQGYIALDPIANMEVPGGERKEVFISEEEYARILSCCPEEAFRDLVVITWETGCRPQELLRVEARHVDLENSRWIFPPSESKGKKAPRIVYLTETALEITRCRMGQFSTGTLFRNSHGMSWTTDAVNCGFDRVQRRMGIREMAHQEIVISPEAVAAFAQTLSPTKRVKGKTTQKTPAELRAEARLKLRNRQAVQLVPRYSLYALRHSWATHALQSGLDGLTVAVLMGHSDPSTLARVYQHLSHNPEHLLKQARKAAARS